jgi:hypothetical protein
MFIASRIANGIVALLALLTSVMLFFGADLAMRPASITLTLIFVFFLCDLILRKEGFTSDIVFTTLWTLLFSYSIYDLMGMFLSIKANPMYYEPLGAAMVFGLTACLINGVPFLLNSIHLIRLLKQRKNPA